MRRRRKIEKKEGYKKIVIAAIIAGFFSIVAVLIPIIFKECNESKISIDKVEIVNFYGVEKKINIVLRNIGNKTLTVTNIITDIEEIIEITPIMTLEGMILPSGEYAESFEIENTPIIINTSIAHEIKPNTVEMISINYNPKINYKAIIAVFRITVYFSSNSLIYKTPIIVAFNSRMNVFDPEAIISFKEISEIDSNLTIREQIIEEITEMRELFIINTELINEILDNNKNAQIDKDTSFFINEYTGYKIKLDNYYHGLINSID